MKRNLIPCFVFVLGLVAGSCGGGVVTYRSYDPYYHDYHVWSDAELPYYNRWMVETHHHHREYRRLHRADREAYWHWRHDHR